MQKDQAETTEASSKQEGGLSVEEKKNLLKEILRDKESLTFSHETYESGGIGLQAGASYIRFGLKCLGREVPWPASVNREFCYAYTSPGELDEDGDDIGGGADVWCGKLPTDDSSERVLECYATYVENYGRLLEGKPGEYLRLQTLGSLVDSLGEDDIDRPDFRDQVDKEVAKVKVENLMRESAEWREFLAKLDSVLDRLADFEKQYDGDDRRLLSLLTQVELLGWEEIKSIPEDYRGRIKERIEWIRNFLPQNVDDAFSITSNMGDANGFVKYDREREETQRDAGWWLSSKGSPLLDKILREIEEMSSLVEGEKGGGGMAALQGLSRGGAKTNQYRTLVISPDGREIPPTEKLGKVLADRNLRRPGTYNKDIYRWVRPDPSALAVSWSCPGNVANVEGQSFDVLNRPSQMTEAQRLAVQTFEASIKVKDAFKLGGEKEEEVEARLASILEALKEHQIFKFALETREGDLNQEMIDATTFAVLSSAKGVFLCNNSRRHFDDAISPNRVVSTKPLGRKGLTYIVDSVPVAGGVLEFLLYTHEGYNNLVARWSETPTAESGSGEVSQKTEVGIKAEKTQIDPEILAKLERRMADVLGPILGWMGRLQVGNLGQWIVEKQKQFGNIMGDIPKARDVGQITSKVDNLATEIEKKVFQLGETIGIKRFGDSGWLSTYERIVNRDLPNKVDSHEIAKEMIDDGSINKDNLLASIRTMLIAKVADIINRVPVDIVKLIDDALDALTK